MDQVYKVIAGPPSVDGSEIEVTHLVNRLLEEGVAENTQDGVTIVTVGANEGVGRLVRDQCNSRGIKFVEFVVFFNSVKRPSKEEFVRVFRVRHGSLVELGTEFHVILPRKKKTVIDDLIDRIKSSGKPFTFYSEKGDVKEASTGTPVKVVG